MSLQSIQPIAIVGMSCRFPAGCDDPEKLWALLSDGKSAWTDVPPDRFQWKSFHHPSADVAGTFSHRGGHFLEQDVSTFDANFFAIPTAEASAMDPQHRLQLESAFEALENAGIPLEKIRGSRTGVYVAIFSRDYDRMMYKDPLDVAAYHITGTGDAIASNRISYTFDLKGPSMTIDTGCSGSLVALHQACQSLRRGETNVSLVGGSNLILSPDQMIPMTLLHVLNPEGKSFAFDSRGAGYGRGEGVATVVLKRLDDALQAGDPIRAVVRNTGLNQDGKTSGITLPNQKAQEDLIRDVYSQIHVDLKDVQYVEAHGTGTVVGDAAEIRSISRVFCSADEPLKQLPVGSVKSNIGHLESASGLAGLIKAVMVLEKGCIPPNVNLDTLKSGLERTNAHAVLEAASGPSLNSEIPVSNGLLDHQNAPACDQKQSLASEGADDIVSQLLVLSARSEESLNRRFKDLGVWASRKSAETFNLDNLAYTLLARRSHFPWRCHVVTTGQKDLVQTLSQGQPKMTKASDDLRLTFIFTGQGAQWYAIGRELIRSSVVFRKSIARSSSILTDLGSTWSLTEELEKTLDSSRINSCEIAQPCTTAIQIALVDLLSELSMHPSSVLGHSSGEIAAAYTAGALTHISAMSVAYYRGVVSAACRDRSNVKGAMLAVNSSQNFVALVIAELPISNLTVACINSPASTTISGDENAIDELKDKLNADGINCQKLKVEIAYHSDHIRKFASEYLSMMQHLEFGRPKDSVKFFSSVTASQKTGSFDAAYWVTNLVAQVRYSDAIAELCRANEPLSSAENWQHACVEIGPHRALSGITSQTLAQGSICPGSNRYIPSLIRGQDSTHSVMQLCSTLYEFGYPVRLDILEAFKDTKPRYAVINDLPSYPWDHSTKYWHESRISNAYRQRQHPRHELLGVRCSNMNPFEPVWRNFLNIAEIPWLRDHFVDNSIIFPGSGYLCMAVEAIRQSTEVACATTGMDRFLLRDIVFSKALIIPATGKIEIQLSMKPQRTASSGSLVGWSDFRISSVSATGSWNENCHGSITVDAATASEEFESTTDANARYQRMVSTGTPTGGSKWDSKQLYRTLRSSGNDYGPNFSLLQNIDFSSRHASASAIVPDVAGSIPLGFMQAYNIHPTTLDALLQINLPSFLQHCSADSIMPLTIEEVSIPSTFTHVPGDVFDIQAQFYPESSHVANADIIAFQAEHKSDRAPVTIHQAQYFGMGDSTHPDRNSSDDRAITYQVRWDLDAGLLTEGAVTFTGAALQDTDKTNQAAVDKIGQLDCAAGLYIKQCVDALVAKPLENPQSHYVYLLHWMRDCAVSDEFLQNTKDLGSERHINIWQCIRQAGVEGEVVDRVGPKLETCMRGELEPLSLLLEGGLLYKLYADDFSTQCYSHLTQHLQLLRFKNPQMKILEIGAGTGGATLPILRSLTSDSEADFLQYDFTDVSPGFFGAARNLLSEWSSKVTYKALDIELDAVAQGFTEASYDLVIASNVLHATHKMDNTLSNVRRLLRADGKLALIELTRLRPVWAIWAGLLPGWWNGYDEGRRDSPLLSVQQWDEALSRNNFSGVEVSAKDFESAAHTATLMISSALRDRIVVGPVNLLTPSLSDSARAFEERLNAVLTGEGIDSRATPWPSEVVDKDMVYLLLDDQNEPLLSQATSHHFRALCTLLTQARRILWVTFRSVKPQVPDCHAGMAVGFARSARCANPMLRLVTLDLRDSLPTIKEDVTATISAILVKSYGPDITEATPVENEYAYGAGRLTIPRLLPQSKINNTLNGKPEASEETVARFHQALRSFKLHVGKPGLLNSLTFVDDKIIERQLDDDEIELETRAFGINFRDVLIALGQMKGSALMSGECSGIVTAVGSELRPTYRVGDRVCAWYATPYASRARVKGSNACPIPQNMSFNMAASIPVVFLTAFYGLVEVARLRAGQTVLIHSAAGGVGQAAILIAKSYQATIFATVGNSSKRDILTSKYQIPYENIFLSRSRSFKQALLHRTAGRGVDVVLNSLAGEALLESWECVARFGTFVEIGKSDIYRNTQLGMKPFDRNVTFASVDLVALADFRPEYIQSLFKKVISEIESGSWKLTEPSSIRRIADIKDAFRLIQMRKHTGKLILEADEHSSVQVASPPKAPTKLDPSGAYVVAGGLGSLGRRIVTFLIEEGARHIIVLSRKGRDSKERAQYEAEIAPLTAEVHIETCDITNSSHVQELAAQIQERTLPIKGVIQAAMILQGRVLERMSVAEFEKVAGPKVAGSANLNRAFANPSLDFFVMLSSYGGIVGSTELANYAAANTYQDELARVHAHSRTKYISLNQGMTEGSDVIALNPEVRAAAIRGGCIPMSFDQLFNLLRYAIGPDAREDGLSQVAVGFDKQSLLESQRSDLLHDPRFSHLAKHDITTPPEPEKHLSRDIGRAIEAICDPAEAKKLIGTALIKQISSLVAIGADDIGPKSSIGDLGLDSLIAIELRAWINRNLQAVVQTTEILDAPDIQSLTSTVADRSSYTKSEGDRKSN